MLLVVLRLKQMGAGRAFTIAVLIIGFLTTFGTIAMTAVSFQVAPAVHKMGIGLYFFGVVINQTLIFSKDWTMKNMPRILPVLSITMVLVYFVFFALIVLYEFGLVERNTPVIWE